MNHSTGPKCVSQSDVFLCCSAALSLRLERYNYFEVLQQTYLLKENVAILNTSPHHKFSKYVCYVCVVWNVLILSLLQHSAGNGFQVGVKEKLPLSQDFEQQKTSGLIQSSSKTFTFFFFFLLLSNLSTVTSRLYCCLNRVGCSG